jgi:hypothetical protein
MTPIALSSRTVRALLVLACAALLAASCGHEPAPPPAPPANTAPASAAPANAAPADAAPASPPPATSPLLASDDDDAGDPAAPKKVVRGSLALPQGAVPQGTQVVGLRRVQLPGVATLRPGTWNRAPRAPVGTDGRFELAVPGHWNSLVLYADSPVLLDEPLHRCDAVPPREELHLIARPGAGRAGRRAPLEDPWTGVGAQELATLRVRGAFGERVLELAPGATFAFARLPLGVELELVLDASGYAPLVEKLTLGSAELRTLGSIGAPLARLHVEVVADHSTDIGGAVCTIDGRTRTTDGCGNAWMPVGAKPLRFTVTPSPAHADLLPLAGRAEGRPLDGWRLALPRARTLRVRALPGAIARIAPHAAEFERREFPVSAAFGARADASGVIELSGLYPAPYALELWSGASPERGSLRATIEHAPNDDELVAALAPVESSRIELRVLTAERNPWPQYRVRILDVEELDLGLVDTLDGTGADAVLMLPAGRWSIRARDEKPGGPRARLELELPRDSDAVHELRMTR